MADKKVPTRQYELVAIKKNGQQSEPLDCNFLTCLINALAFNPAAASRFQIPVHLKKYIEGLGNYFLTACDPWALEKN